MAMVSIKLILATNTLVNSKTVVFMDSAFMNPQKECTVIEDISKKERSMGMVLQTSKGWKYTGQWKDDQLNGIGSLQTGLWRYQGSWVDGKYHGRGTIHGSKHFPMLYDGEWEDGRHHGRGLVTFPGGRKYEEEREAGTGKVSRRLCVHWHHLEDSYVGQRNECDEPHGQGTLTLPDGSYYEGLFENAKWTGGTHVAPNGKRYEGTFQNQKRHDEGIYYFANGDRYEGSFRRGNFHGEGTFFSHDGKMDQGRWKNGKRLKIQQNEFSGLS